MVVTPVPRKATLGMRLSFGGGPARSLASLPPYSAGLLTQRLMQGR